MGGFHHDRHIRTVGHKGLGYEGFSQNWRKSVTPPLVGGFHHDRHIHTAGHKGLGYEFGHYIEIAPG